MAYAKYLKPALKCFGLALIVYGASKVIALKLAADSNDKKSPFNELSVYVSVLENESLQKNLPLTCSAAVESTFHFADQWGGFLHCRTDENHLFITSDGPDGQFGNSDDLVVRRRIK